MTERTADRSASAGNGSVAPDRTSPPEPGPVRSFELPAVQPRRLDNGLALKVLRQDRLPLATLALVLDAGESTVEPEEAGLAVLTGEALEGGTRRWGADALARALEGIGADLEVRTGWDATTVALTVLPERLEEALDLLAEVVRRPSFPSSEVERVRDQQRAALRQRAMNPGQVAEDEAVRRIFAQGSPFGRPLPGTVESVSQMGPEAARSFVERRYGPSSGGLVAVGDLDPERVAGAGAQAFGDWGSASGAASAAQGAPGDHGRRIVVVHRPGAVQSELRVGHLGVARSSPDYVPLQLFNTILGGAFTSRLNLKLREERGFTYGVRSQFAFRRAPGPFVVSTAVGTEQTPQAVADTLEGIEALVRDGPTEEEVEAARDYLTGVFPLRFETTSQTASRLAELVVHDLPDDYHSTYRDRIREVASEEVHAAGQRVVRPEELLVLVVGDAEALEEPLRELDSGPVEVVESPETADG